MENLASNQATPNGPPPGEVQGHVFDIQRFSLHDGPGIRTTVFLKGCPLRCLWCHNPEGISASPAVSFQVENCIACGECARICQHGAHHIKTFGSDSKPATHVYDRAQCEACGSCVEFCDTGALEIVGRSMTVQQVMQEVVQDRAFFANSGGGITISGGEPLSQIDFTLALLRTAREQAIHRCVETSGFASWQRFRALLPLVNLFLFDCKETDERRHTEFTGHSNHLILQNLRALHAAGARIQLQCPIIPGHNDREDHLAGIAALAKSLDKLEGVRLLPYHPMGESKRRRFSLSTAAELPRQPLDPNILDHWTDWLCEHGVRVLNGTDALSPTPP